MKIDCHVHTFLSSDSFQSFDTVVRQAVKRGLDGIVVVDHNVATHGDEIQAAVDRYFMEHPESKPLRVFRGGEYSTEQGHIIVLGMTTPLEQCISRVKGTPFDARTLIAEARKQGAFVILAHPYRLARFEPDESLYELIDAVEVFNGRNCFIPGRFNANHRALQKAKEYGLPITVGTDGHAPGEIGRSYVEFDVAPEDFTFYNLAQYKARVHARFGPQTEELLTKLRYYRKAGHHDRIGRAIRKYLRILPRRWVAAWQPDTYLHGEFVGFNPAQA